MSSLLLHLFAGLGILVAGGFIAINILAWNHAYALLHYSGEGAATGHPDELSRFQKAIVLFEGINVPRPTGSRTPADFQLAYEPVRIPARSHVNLGAWYCPAASSQSMVILFHGYALDKSSLLPEAAAFHDMGLSCLLVDFRGSGDSSGSHTTIGLEEGADVAAAYRYARERFPDTRLILFGQSMGSAAILRAIRDEKQVQPGAIILESVFDTMLQTALNRFTLLKLPGFPHAHLIVFWGGRQFGFNAFRHNPAAYARSVTCPSLFLQGEADGRARPQDAKRVFEAIATETKEFREFSGVGHESYVARHPEGWRQAAEDFFRKHALLG
jgi:alpha-beta hydrolase superfamily lysophospholipase